jgi:RNA recognition motif-containing protein
MNKKIYVGNLNFSTTEQQLSSLFEQYGTVETAQIVVDRFSGRSRGFGFVEMENADAANQAIQALDGYSLDGRSLRVNEANSKPRREDNRY